MDKIFYDDDKTYHILHVCQFESSIKITEYGRFNKHFERATINMILPTRKNILKKILDSFHIMYSFIDGDLFITGSDKHYVFNSVMRTLSIRHSNTIFLNPCNRENLYKSDDNNLALLHDPISNELLFLKDKHYARSIQDVVLMMHDLGSISPSIRKKRIKHFTKEYQVMGTIEFKFCDQDVKAHIQFHETLDFEDIENRSCIFNITKKIQEKI